MRKKSFISTGIPTIFMVFAVLCLVILALMSWGTSMNDLASARLSLTQSEKYYEACSLGTALLEQIRQEAALQQADHAGEYRPEELIQAIQNAQMPVQEETRPVPDAQMPVQEETSTVPDAQTPVQEETYPVLEEILWDDGTDQGQLRIRFSARLSLQIDFSLIPEEPYYKVLGWFTVSSGEWNPDQSQNLFVPDDPGFLISE